MAIALATGAVVSLLIPQLQSLWPLAVLWMAEAAAFAAAVPAEEALVVDLAGGSRRGTAFGYYTAAAGLGAVDQRDVRAAPAQGQRDSGTHDAGPDDGDRGGVAQRRVAAHAWVSRGRPESGNGPLC